MRWSSPAEDRAVAEEVSEQAYNELVAIRREKLRGLQEPETTLELTSYPQADLPPR